MHWQDEGIVIAVRRHGESSVIVDLLTPAHGRWSGMVRGGRSKRMRPILQLGNKVEARWQARLPEHLGLFMIDGLHLRAALMMEEAVKLLALQSICVLLGALAEREAHEKLYAASDEMIEVLAGEGEEWPVLLVRWELGLLAELGFGLDLSCCAATGAGENLTYVSPKSGRAVCRDAGEPYKAKLLDLPGFLMTPGKAAGADELRAGLELSGFFLHKFLFAPDSRPLPDVRTRLAGHFSR